MTMTRPGSEVFKGQLEIIEHYADLRIDRANEINAQLGGPAAFLASIVFLDPERNKWTLELLSAVLRLASYVEMRFKHSLACRRPIEFSPQIQPMILTPTHGTLPSGHATEAFISAHVLWKLVSSGYVGGGSDLTAVEMRQLGTQFMRQAARIAINRTVAGVHFPVDSAAGASLGLTLADYFVKRCMPDESSFNGWSFDGTKYPVDTDFNWHDYLEQSTTSQKAATIGGDAVTAISANADANLHSEMLCWLWNKALTEWQRPR